MGGDSWELDELEVLVCFTVFIYFCCSVVCVTASAEAGVSYILCDKVSVSS